MIQVSARLNMARTERELTHDWNESCEILFAEKSVNQYRSALILERRIDERGS